MELPMLHVLGKEDGAWHLVNLPKSRVVTTETEKYLRVRKRDGCGKGDELVRLQEMFQRLRFAPRMATADDVGLLREGLFVVALSVLPNGEEKWCDCEIIRHVQSTSSHQLHVKWHITTEGLGKEPQSCVLNMNGPPCVQLLSNRDVGSHPKFKEWRAQLVEQKVGPTVVDLTTPPAGNSPDNADTEIVNLIDIDDSREHKRKSRTTNMDAMLEQKKSFLDDPTGSRMLRLPGMMHADAHQIRHPALLGSFGQPYRGVNYSSYSQYGLNNHPRRGPQHGVHDRIDLTCGEDYSQHPINWALPQRQFYPVPHPWLSTMTATLPRSIHTLCPGLAPSLREGDVSLVSVAKGNGSWDCTAHVTDQPSTPRSLARPPCTRTNVMIKPTQSALVKYEGGDEHLPAQGQQGCSVIDEIPQSTVGVDNDPCWIHAETAPEGMFADVDRLGLLYLALCCFNEHQTDCLENLRTSKVKDSLKRKRISWNDF